MWCKNYIKDYVMWFLQNRIFNRFFLLIYLSPKRSSCVLGGSSLILRKKCYIIHRDAYKSNLSHIPFPRFLTLLPWRLGYSRMVDSFEVRFLSDLRLPRNLDIPIRLWCTVQWFRVSAPMRVQPSWSIEKSVMCHVELSRFVWVALF